MSTLKGENIFLDSCLLVLRVTVGFLMIHHGFEKLADIDGFTTFIVDQYFPFLPFDHSLWTILAAYTQIIGSILIVLGVLTRPALTGLAFTMLFALVFHGLDTGLQGAPFAVVEAHNYEFETSALYFVIFVVLGFLGSGKFAFSSIFKNNLPDWAQIWI